MAEELEEQLSPVEVNDRRESVGLDYPTYVIVGNGPVGIRCAQKLLDQGEERSQVVIFGAESVGPYNRVKLSQYLSDHLSVADLENPIHAESGNRLAEFVDRKVVSIDRTAKTVTDSHGNIQPYDKLILATGSEPAFPDLPGIQLQNVLPFRSLRNAETLIQLRDECRHICVIGAGALGLEAAAALKTHKNRVTLQSRSDLLGGLLGEEGSEYLQWSLTALGVELRVGEELASLCGDTRVEQLEFAGGETLDVDAVVICTGIRPEVSLAQDCGLKTARGIVTNEWMQTSDPDIYAVGECAEFADTLYQLVRPGYEQAESCCAHICQEAGIASQAQPYTGSTTDIQLKIAHIPCAIIGEAHSDSSTGEELLYIYRNRFKGLYRLLRVKNRRIVGAVHIGSWDEVNRLRQAVSNGEPVSSRALRKFERDGELWQKQPRGIKAQPDSYLVCQCNGVSKGELCEAISNGKRNLMDLQQATNAGSVCGSCRPLIAELLDTPTPNLVMRHARGIFITSMLSLLLIVLAALMPPVPVSESVQNHWYWQKLWYDNFWKQVSGYTLLGFCLLTATLSLRKRWRKLSFGHVDHWRYVHSLFGGAAMLVLAVHTGFRLGQNLNLALMLVFLTATTTGALVGVFMARNHHWTDMKLREHRKWWSRVHYALLWALPALLAYHILAVYYF